MINYYEWSFVLNRKIIMLTIFMVALIVDPKILLANYPTKKLVAELQEVQALLISPNFLTVNTKGSGWPVDNEHEAPLNEDFKNLFLNNMRLSAKNHEKEYPVPIKFIDNNEYIKSIRHAFLLIQYRLGYEIILEDKKKQIYSALYADLYYVPSKCANLNECSKKLFVTYPAPFYLGEYELSTHNSKDKSQAQILTTPYTIGEFNESTRSAFYKVTQEIIIFLNQNKFFLERK